MYIEYTKIFGRKRDEYVHFMLSIANFTKSKLAKAMYLRVFNTGDRFPLNITYSHVYKGENGLRNFTRVEARPCYRTFKLKKWLEQEIGNYGNL